jgi:hypothetical protein
MFHEFIWSGIVMFGLACYVFGVFLRKHPDAARGAAKSIWHHFKK